MRMWIFSKFLIMKIIKEFDSNEYAKKMSPGLIDPFLKYGLGDDGNLYCKCSISGYSFRNNWIKPTFYISIREMKKIVDNFEHLMVWV